MVQTGVQGMDEKRYMDGYLYNNMQILKEAVKQNWDGVLLIGGMEGAGKSTLGAQCAAVLDETFVGADAVRRTCFTLDQLKKAVDEASPGQAVVYDESWKDMNSGARYGKNQQEIIRMLTEKRKKRLYWIIIAPTFFDITKYLAIHRSRAYIHVWAKGLERGHFNFYGPDHKQDLYIRGKKDWNIKVVKPTFYGAFTKWIPYERDEYEAKKDAATKADGSVTTEQLATPESVRQTNILNGYIGFVLFKRFGLKKAVLDRYYEHDHKTGARYIKKAEALLFPVDENPSPVAGGRDLENPIVERGDPEEEEVVE